MLTPEEAVRFCLEEARETTDNKRIQKLMDISQMLLELNQLRASGMHYWTNGWSVHTAPLTNQPEQIMCGDSTGKSDLNAGVSYGEDCVLYKDKDMVVSAEPAGVTKTTM